MKGSITFRFLIAILLLCLASLAFAQSNTGTVQGTVKDVQGAVISGASVTITNLGTGRAIPLKSNQAGLFSLPALDPGMYKVEVKQPNFRTIVQQVTLQTAQVINLELILQPGSVSETVEVTSDAPVVETTTSGLGQVIQGREVTELPLNGRNFTSLAALTPGVTRAQPGNQQSGSGNQAETFRYAESGGAALSVNGLRPQANNFLFDGLDNNESLVNTIVFFVPPDAIQEFRVDTNVAPAEYGRAGGGVVNASYRQGSNTWHGTAFWQIRNDDLDASPNYFNPNDSRPEFRRNQFGFAGGGALIKNKLFIYGDYQGVRQFKPLSGETATVPTDLERSGNFSQLPYQLYYPGATSLATRVPVAGNNFSGMMIPAGQNYLKAFPEPNITSGSDPRCSLAGTDGTCMQNNYQAHRTQIQHYNDFDVRLDYVFGAKDQAFARYSYGQDIDETSPRLSTLPSGYGSGYQFQHPRGFMIGENHIFNTSIINEFRLGYLRSFLGYLPPFGSTPISADLGIPNANTSPLLGGGALIGNTGSQIEYTGDYGSYMVPENTYQLADNLSWVKGRHTLKFGTNLIWRQVNFFNPIAGKGFFQPNSGAAYSTGNDMTDLLAGWMGTYQVGPASGMFGTRSWENGFYGQDDWRITNRLTLNLGFRYDYFTWPTEMHNRMANFDLATGDLVQAGENGVSDSTINTPKKNFAPRIGFAYDLTGKGKTVVRGGYGIFYFIDRGGIDKQLSQNAPYGGSASYSYDQGYRFTLGGQAPMNSTGAPVISEIGTVAMPSKDRLNVDLNDPANVSLTAWLPNDKTSSVQQWNLQVEHQLDNATSVSLGYVGTKGTHLSTYYDANRPAYNTGILPYPKLGHIAVNDTSGNSIYNGMTVQIQRRMAKGLQFQSSYTWSHAIDDSPGAFDNDFRYGGNVVDPADWQKKERANSNLDTRNRFIFSMLYELPFGHGRTFGSDWKGPMNALLGGWQISPMVNLSSGFPFDVTCTYCTGLSTRPNLVGKLHQTNSINEWFDTSAFQRVPSSVAGVPVAPGDSPRNPFTGAATKQVDLSVGKEFRVTEVVKFSFRSEIFNLFNTPQFSQPDGNMNDGGNFGKVTSIRLSSERQLQFSFRVSF